MAQATLKIQVKVARRAKLIVMIYGLFCWAAMREPQKSTIGYIVMKFGRFRAGEKGKWRKFPDQEIQR